MALLILDLRVKRSSTQGQIMGLANGAIRGFKLYSIICRIGLINKGAVILRLILVMVIMQLFSIFETFDPQVNKDFKTLKRQSQAILPLIAEMPENFSIPNWTPRLIPALKRSLMKRAEKMCFS